jgi:hypothetical protein
MRDLTGWYVQKKTALSQRPKPTGKDEWPPDYSAILRWRAETLEKLTANPEALAGAKEYYRTRPGEFIMDWMDTYDPRVRDGDKWMPFVFFRRQAEVIEFFESCKNDGESGLVEKCRDAGLSWLAVGYSVHQLLFVPDIAIGWGSRTQDLVDKLGSADSIFEKLRLVLRRLPEIWLPRDFNWSRHSKQMLLMNPENGSYIEGQIGRKIGRGGRKTVYFVDEAAHLEGQEEIEASLGDNTFVRIDISSVNGMGNIFHRRRENGIVWEPGMDMPRGYVRVFIMDWRDHPKKTQEWYDTRKARYEREGLAHLFAQEVDRNYSAAVSNVVIPMEWILAAVDAHKDIPYMASAVEANSGKWMAGLDVADSGTDRNALAIREWVILRSVEEWGDRDPGASARTTIFACRNYRGRIAVQYDCIGIGAGVKTEYNRMVDDDRIITAKDVPFVPWNAGGSVLRPNDRVITDDDTSVMNKDFYENIKAQAWWSLRMRFYKTFKARTEGIVYPVDELISLDSSIRPAILEKVKKELGQPTFGPSSRMRMLIEKKPDGTKSPNIADAIMMSYFPLPTDDLVVKTGRYGV